MKTYEQMRLKVREVLCSDADEVLMVVERLTRAEGESVAYAYMMGALQVFYAHRSEGIEIKRKVAKKEKRAQQRIDRKKLPPGAEWGEPQQVVVEYAKYINSPAWARKREEFWESLGFKGCQVEDCLSKENFHVHHHTYVRLGNEDFEDLVGLCAEHHDDVHKFFKTYKGKLLPATCRRMSIDPGKALTVATEYVTGIDLRKEGSAEVVRKVLRSKVTSENWRNTRLHYHAS